MSIAPLLECAYNGLECRTKRCSDVLPQFFLSFYGADLAETEDLLGIKRGGRDRFSCDVCLIVKESLNVTTSFPKRK